MTKKNIGKIVKAYDKQSTTTLPAPKKADPFVNQQAQMVADGKIQANLICYPAPAPITNNDKLLRQAIYYVANDRPKDARKCLLAIDLGHAFHMNSFQAKCWVKEEAAVQKRHPQERNRYHGKPMPQEYQLIGV